MRRIFCLTLLLTLGMVYNAAGDQTVTGRLIRLEGNALTLIDLRSKNGTLVNKVKLTPNASQHLRDGDEIIFGDQKFTLE